MTKREGLLVERKTIIFVIGELDKKIKYLKNLIKHNEKMLKQVNTSLEGIEE